MLPSAVDIAQHGPVVSRRASVAPTIEEVAPAPSPPPSPPNDASTPGACATGVLASEFNSLGGTPLLALPSVGSRALGEGWPSCDAALAATDAAADATPLRRSGFDGRTAARPQRKFNLRFVALVKWDLACFLCSLLLLLAAVCAATPPHRTAAAPPHRTAATPPHRRTVAPLSALLHLAHPPSFPPLLCTSAGGARRALVGIAAALGRPLDRLARGAGL